MKLQRRGKTLCAECNMPIVFDREARIITHEVNTPDCLEAVVFPTSLGQVLKKHAQLANEMSKELEAEQAARQRGDDV